MPPLTGDHPSDPTSDNNATYIVRIEGDPDVDCRLALGPPKGHDAGAAAMTATAMRIVNAVPHMVDAEPGLLNSLDLPVTGPGRRLRPGPVLDHDHGRPPRWRKPCSVAWAISSTMTSRGGRSPPKKVVLNAAIPATIATVERAAKSW